MAGICDTTAPPRRWLEGGVEVFCHRTAADLISLQKVPEPLADAAASA
jgi:peptide/nickel transport system ATP-binding protein